MGFVSFLSLQSLRPPFCNWTCPNYQLKHVKKEAGNILKSTQSDLFRFMWQQKQLIQQTLISGVSRTPQGHLCAPVHVPHPVPVAPLRSSCPLWFVSELYFIIKRVSAQPFQTGPIWICQGITCCWMGHCEVNARQEKCWKRNVPIF